MKTSKERAQFDEFEWKDHYNFSDGIRDKLHQPNKSSKHTDMKNLLLKLFAPILNALENAEGVYEYRSLHRTILKVMGVLFLGLSAVGLYFVMQISQYAGLLPVILFSGIGLLCLVVAYLGSDKAVAKIWRNRNEH